MPETTTPLLDIKGLTLAFSSSSGGEKVLHDIDLVLKSGEKAALIGESGSGKTLLARTLIDLLPKGCERQSGTLYWKGQPVDGEALSLKSLRGRDIAYIFQEPLSSLNPALKIGTQLTEAYKHHFQANGAESQAVAIDMLAKAKLKNPEKLLSLYPHELSGGMRQRIMIAGALMLRPALLIADEPTTALDMAIRQDIMALMTELAEEAGSALLIISHDIGTVAAVAETVHVLKHGKLVESGSASKILSQPEHSYTQSLLQAIPQPRPLQEKPANAEAAEANEPLLRIKNLSVQFSKTTLFSRAATQVKALDNISLTIDQGETFALIGESGSGKTTLSRSVSGLQSPTTGCVRFNWPKHLQDDPGKLQFIFQDPVSALNPRMRVADLISESVLYKNYSKKQRLQLVDELLEQVELSSSYARRFPHELSGGQRQRVCIARALAPKPAFIIADEPIAALDVTVQKQILDLFADLREKYGFACLFVSHDLGVVEHAADRVGVLKQGKLVETGPADEIFNRPQHPYTRELLASTPCLISSQDNMKIHYRLTNRLKVNPEIKYAADR